MRLDHKTNNFWQATRLRKVRNEQNVERAQERGIEPITLEEASKATSHLPKIPGKYFYELSHYCVYLTYRQIRLTERFSCPSFQIPW